MHAVHLVDRVDRDDVRVRELRRGLGLAQEARADLGAVGELRGQDLDRDHPLEAAVLGAIDDAHPPATDLAIELVGRRERPLDDGAQLGLGCGSDGLGHSGVRGGGPN